MPLPPPPAPEPRTNPRRDAWGRTALAALLAPAVVLAAVLFACSSESPPVLGEQVAPPPTGGDTCTPPQQGCACFTGGEVRACGVTVARQGDDVTCTTGTMTCSGTAWGACIADGVTPLTVRHLPAIGSLHTLALATGTSNCNDPCDPSCVNYPDTPQGLDAGDAGLKITEAGLSLYPSDAPPPIACTSLTLLPTPAANNVVTLTSVTPVSPSTFQFHAQLVPSNCALPGDAPAIFQSDRPDLVTIDSTGLVTIVSPVATTVTVTAYSGSFTATNTLKIVVNTVDTSAVTSLLSAATITSILTSSGTGNDSLAFLYPYPNTVLPLSLPAPIIQWSSGTGASAPTYASATSYAEINLSYPANGSQFSWTAINPELQTLTTQSGPTPTGGGAAPTVTLSAQQRAIIPANIWSALERTATGQDAYIGVQRYSAGNVYKQQTVKIHFATGQLKGTVYYNSYGTNLAQNYSPTYNGASFGAATLAIKPNATVPVLVAGNSTSQGCRVCHSVAANGANLITQGPADTTSVTINLLSGNTETVIPNQSSGNFSWPAMYPDGTKFFTNSSPLQGAGNTAASALVTTATGNVVSGVTGLPSSLRAGTPAFSPDGAHVAFNYYGGTSADQKSLASMDFDGVNKFSNFQTLATPGSGSLSAGKTWWPSYLPTGGDIVFHLETVVGRGTVAETRSNCDQRGPVACQNEGVHSELWWLDGATKKVNRLNCADGNADAHCTGFTLPAHASYTGSSGGDSTLNYEPTVNPQITGGYAWVIFTSRRLYGNIATINPFWSDPRYQDLSTNPTPKKLWVAAIDPNAAASTDASYPAFYLPGQELLAGNSRGYWVLDACKAGGTPSSANVCNSSLDCCSPATCTLDPPPLANPPVSHCLSPYTGACVTTGSACTSNSQCCAYPNAVCSQATGLCTVPPPPIVYQEADYVRDYPSACSNLQRPLWRQLQYQTITPSDSKIIFQVQTADTVAAVPTAPSTALATIAGASNLTFTGQDVEALLHTAGLRSALNLRVTIRLIPSTDTFTAPTLIQWNQAYDCVDAQ